MKKWFEKRMEFLSKLSERLNDELQNCQHLRTSGGDLREQQCLDCGELL
jgi:hypothetical protein